MWFIVVAVSNTFHGGFVRFGDNTFCVRHLWFRALDSTVNAQVMEYAAPRQCARQKGAIDRLTIG